MQLHFCDRPKSDLNSHHRGERPTLVCTGRCLTNYLEHSATHALPDIWYEVQKCIIWCYPMLYKRNYRIYFSSVVELHVYICVNTIALSFMYFFTFISDASTFSASRVFNLNITSNIFQS